MNTPIVPAKKQSSQPRIVRRELNFDFGQLFYPQERRKLFDIRYLSSEITDHEGNKQTVKAIVKPDATLGTLNTFDERTFYVLFEIWEEHDRSRECYFSEREIARKLKIKWGRDTAKAINDSLNRLRGVFIEWEGSFYDASKKRFITIKNPFTILSHLKVVSTKDEHFRAQIAEFSFDKRVVENFNCNYCRPVKFDIVLSFRSPLAQSLYNLLDRKLYGTTTYHRTTKGLLINDLGLIGSSYQRKANRVQYLKRIKDEILGIQTGYDEIIEHFEIDTSGKGDAILRVRRSKGKGSKIEEKTKSKKTVSKENEASKKQPQTKKGSKINENASESPQLSQNGSTPSQNNQSAQNGSQELSKAERAVIYFHKIFHKQSNPHIELASVKKAQGLLNEYGSEKVKYFINFAYEQSQKTGYKPNTFQAIMSYINPALGAYEEHKLVLHRAEVSRQEAIDNRREKQRLDHYHDYKFRYYDYIDTLMNSVCDKYPDKVNRCRQYHAERVQLMIKNARAEGGDKKQLRETVISFMGHAEQIVESAVTFFKDDSAISLPTFWEWDSEHNPERFNG